MAFEFFLLKAFDPDQRFVFFAWVLVVVVSITLHELAHGWAALRRGDDTPVRAGHMTLNPLVHMGPFSIAALLIAGLAWGQMPIDPTRMRGRYAEADVAAAGPGVNVMLAVVGAIGVGLMERFGWVGDAGWSYNLWQLLHVMAVANAFLAVFNLMPAPPLDGSRILACVNDRYARFIGDPSNGGVVMFMFIGVFMLSGVFLPWVQRAVAALETAVTTFGL